MHQTRSSGLYTRRALIRSTAGVFGIVWPKSRRIPEEPGQIDLSPTHQPWGAARHVIRTDEKEKERNLHCGKLVIRPDHMRSRMEM